MSIDELIAKNETETKELESSLREVNERQSMIRARLVYLRGAREALEAVAKLPDESDSDVPI